MEYMVIVLFSKPLTYVVPSQPGPPLHPIRFTTLIRHMFKNTSQTMMHRHPPPKNVMLHSLRPAIFRYPRPRRWSVIYSIMSLFPCAPGHTLRGNNLKRKAIPSRKRSQATQNKQGMFGSLSPQHPSSGGYVLQEDGRSADR